MADYGRLDDKTANNFDARFFALGGTYALSRRTDFYAVASRLANRGNAHYLIADASNTGLQTSSNAGLPVPGFFGGNVNAGFSPSSFQVGMRHRF
jgi:predicted porin